jgi:protein tyrosine phosphatase (PTP) superfamily phosphohydrolase (DUF442 family)
MIGALIFAAALSVAPVLLYGASAPPGTSSKSLKDLLKVEVPVVLCIDDKPTAGGQPSAGAYAKAAAHGYRSILTLRNDEDGVNLLRERSMVERQKMRYFNIPVSAKTPSIGQVDKFLALARDRENHPMLINCGFAERVAPLMMIFRIVEQGWSKEKALDEAVRMGLRKEPLETFADSYLARRKSKPS